MKRLENKVSIITGAAQGIGLATALKFAQEGASGIVRDITQEVHAREANARLLREQQLIFQNAETGIVILRDRVIQRCNRRFTEILGYAPDELIGQSTRIYYPSEEAWLATGRQAYAAIAETGIYHGDTLFHRRDGTTLWCHITGSMINPANPDEGYVWLYEDVTEKRQANRVMNALLREQTLIFEPAPIGLLLLPADRAARGHQTCVVVLSEEWQGALQLFVREH